MKPTLLRVPFTSFFLLGSVIHLALTIPALAITVVLDLLELQATLFLFLVFFFSHPIAILIAWLIAKGSNWANTATAFKVIGGLSGQLYGFFLGGLIGSRYFGPWGAFLIGGLLFVLGKFGGFWLGDVVLHRLIASSKAAGTSDGVFPPPSQ